MIDWARVIELRDEIGAEDFREVVDLFLQEVEGSLGRLSLDSDPATLESTLHFLKSSALNLGFTALSTICQAGESAAARGDVSGIDKEAVMRVYALSKMEFVEDMPARLAA